MMLLMLWQKSYF